VTRRLAGPHERRRVRVVSRTERRLAETRRRHAANWALVSRDRGLYRCTVCGRLAFDSYWTPLPKEH
jgi:hypothetical protein